MKIWKVAFVFFVLVLAFIFKPFEVRCAQGTGVLFYEEKENGFFQEKWEYFAFGEMISLQERIQFLFQRLLDNPQEYQSFIPEGTTIQRLSLQEDGALTISLSHEATQTAGWHDTEKFIDQMMKTGYSLDGIRSIIIYVEEEIPSFSDGVDLSVYEHDLDNETTF